ncbi:MAG TPA: hypothetical protein DHV42_02110, partial [Lachnospiraceae bacterium]|nr:hypothetical protein [Lachnospiraceae bacterium]
MSSQEKKREQAMRLLHGMTEIDDRFLIEALGEEAGQPTGQEHAADEKQGGLFTAETGRKKPHGRNYYRYSRWALTVAACLAVVIIGRYVGVSSVKNSSAQRMDNAQVQENTGGQEKDEAVPKDVVAPEKDSADHKKTDAADRAREDGEEPASMIQAQAAEEAEDAIYDAEEEAA